MHFKSKLGKWSITLTSSFFKNPQCMLTVSPTSRPRLHKSLTFDLGFYKEMSEDCHQVKVRLCDGYPSSLVTIKWSKELCENIEFEYEKSESTQIHFNKYHIVYF